MEKAVLITQCLQNDFVEPIDKYDPLPNMLHIGYSEAKRLMGENLSDSPVHSVIDWAYRISEKDLAIIHIRDWHDSSDHLQEEHLTLFGEHCLKNTRGAEFVFKNQMLPGRKDFIVNASGINDFIDTNLEEILSGYQNQKMKIGLMGVWTEAKILFLSYELKSRYPFFEIGLCSALTASSSRATHFNALDQIKNILGIRIFSSVGDFTTFLGNSLPDIQTKLKGRENSIQIDLDPPFSISETDKKILAYLFKDCRKVELKSLDGGFSGNLVLKAKSTDILGHKQVPTVIKIGQRNLISKERMSFEKIQEVMGNNAPNIVDSVELEDRGGIKYRYASMLDTQVKTFQDFYEQDGSQSKISQFLDIVFKDHLGRLYEASEYEKLNLLNYYDFQAKYAPFVRKNVEAVIEKKAGQETIEIIPGKVIPNVCSFYEKDLLTLKEYTAETHYMAYLHGDLNGKNIIIDHQSNVWLIDFFHTHRGHILKDLIKMENDILYIFTKINSLEELQEGLLLTDKLLNIHDLKPILPKKWMEEFKFPQIKKAFLSIRKLRSFYADLIQTDRDPYQIYTGLMRYAMHTLSFDESNLFQKKWALYTGSLCAEKIKNSIYASKKLRIDFLTLPKSAKGKIGLTLLPGRKDKERMIYDDLEVLKENQITHIVCLLTEDEMVRFGVPDLKKQYAEKGFEVYYFPILDQGITEKVLTHSLFDWIENALENKKNILIHCVGGLGRSGMIAAAFLKNRFGFSPEEAISTVRKTRGERAVETRSQEQFVYDYD